ncbi:MAG: TolC family protein [Methylococcales bacterium]|jgi:outer membrane protein, adhesin transport system|nr:TolC family protein [Methylococcales bacterium]MBT7445855.1 TolC family protein [Methylococcales bacterium]
MKIVTLLFSSVIPFLLPSVSTAENLQGVVQYMLQYNPDVLADMKEVQARHQDVKQAKSGYLPTVDIAYGVGFEESDNSTTRDEFKKNRELIRKERSLNINQMIFDGFATSSEVDRQHARVDSQAYRLKGVAGVTSLRAVEVYLAVLRIRQLVRLAEDSLQFHQQTYDQIKLRSDAGVGRKSDLDQVAGRLALALSNLSIERSNLMDADTNYLRVIGVLPAAEMDKPSEI